MNLDYEINVTLVSDEEFEERTGITREQLERWDEAYCRGDIPDEPLVIKNPGRPRKFAEDAQIVGFREPAATIAFIDQRAGMLGMTRSDYLRHLVDEDLRAAGLTRAS